MTTKLCDYSTGATIRPATLAEALDSLAAAARDGGAGVISVDGRSCYVEGCPRVEAGDPRTEDYDTGRVLAVDGDRAEVGWDSGVRTWIAVAELREAAS